MSQHPPSLYTGFDLAPGQRILSVLKFAILALIFIPFGVGATALLVAAFCAAMAYEWYKITTQGHVFDEPVTGAVLAAAALPPFVTFAAGPAVGVIVALLAAAFIIQIGPRDPDHLNVTAPGAAVIGIAGVSFVALRADPEHGIAVALWLLLVTWGAELGGEIIGERFGPGQTDAVARPNEGPAGLVGAILGAFIAGSITILVYREGSAAQVMLASAIAGAICYAADMVEPNARRRFGMQPPRRLPMGLHGSLNRLGGLVGVSLFAGFLVMSGGTLFGW